MKMSEVFRLPISRGQYLDLPQYENMAMAWKTLRQQEESKQIFDGFLVSDNGRSRRHIATVDIGQSENFLKAICEAVNTYDTHLSDIHRLLEGLKPFADWWEENKASRKMNFGEKNQYHTAHQLRTELIKTYGER